MLLSAGANKLVIEENRVYIIFTVEEVMDILGRSNETAVKILDELDGISGNGVLPMDNRLTEVVSESFRIGKIHHAPI